MGRSSRTAKFQHPKRVQVLDDEGWTHVTTSSSKRPAPRTHDPVRAVEDQLIPAEIPDDLTFEKLKSRYESHKERWQESITWNAVKRTLEAELSRWPPGSIESCVCVGLGSPSGLLRGGLVDRRSVSLFQLAALVSILEFTSTISSALPMPVESRKVFAQDPVFNDMDKALLDFVGVEVVEDPKAFSLISEHTFLYAPGAERTHLVRLLSKNPILFFGGPLENSLSNNVSASGEDISTFTGMVRSFLLPDFQHNPSAFWKTSLFWRANG